MGSAGGNRKTQPARKPPPPAAEGQIRYPDFVCVGAQKAGTTWLDKNLRQHPLIWLPPTKELHYFDAIHMQHNVGAKSRFANSVREVTRAMGKPEISPTGQRWEAEDGDRFYGLIFGFAPQETVCGEVTPKYSLLPHAGIEHILRLQPSIKFILMMRDPIERAWSANRRKSERKRWRGNEETPFLVERGNYPEILQRFRDCSSEQQVIGLYFDDLLARPHALLRELCEFLNVDYARANFQNLEMARNTGPDIPMDPKFYAKYLEKLEPVYKQMLSFDHPIPRRWYNKHYR